MAHCLSGGHGSSPILMETKNCQLNKQLPTGYAYVRIFPKHDQSVRYSATKAVNPIWSQKQAIFVWKTLPQKPWLRHTMTCRIIFSFPLRSFVHTLTVPKIENRQLSKSEVWLKLLKAGVKMRRRESTPLEELQSDRETRFLQDEQRASKRSMRDDSS